MVRILMRGWKLLQHSQDNGELSVVVRNPEGEDRTSGRISCTPRDSIMRDPLHDASWRRIQVGLFVSLFKVSCCFVFFFLVRKE